MRLLKAQVRSFRCVDDSGDFSLSDVTCLVGKNESGKTAILKALHKLKPEDETVERFEPARDYPRRRWLPGTAIPDDPPAIATLWRLEDDEYKALEGKFGRGALSGREVGISKGYDNARSFEVTVKESAVVKHIIAAAELSAEEKKPIADATTVDEVRKGLEALATPTEPQKQLLKRVREEFADGVDGAVIAELDELVPTFLYFDEYQRLAGEVSLDQLATRKSQGKLTKSDRILESLLGLANTTVEVLNTSPTFEEFNASLRAVSIRITDMIFKYWTQNRHLSVDLRINPGRPGDPIPFNTGSVFRTRIDNMRHKADTNFDDRSTGFVWFFSFLVWFYRLRQTAGKKLVILLDEPGLSLHARAQGDLLRYIREQLKPEYQVVYTTHSPFMVDPDDVLSARTVEDVVIKDKVTEVETLLGTQVGEKVLSTDKDTISPLQRALDYEMTQTLFVGRHTVLVEGASDFLYLKWFSRQLEKADKPGLDYRWTISIGGGVDRIPGFVSLFRGNQLDVAAIVDRQTGDKQRIEKAEKALEAGHLLSLDAYADQKEADIEDVLGRKFYVALVNKAFDLTSSLAIPATKPADALPRVAIEVKDRFALMPPNSPEFSHTIPATYLFRGDDQGAELPGFAEALKRMEKLVGALNALLK